MQTHHNVESLGSPFSGEIECVCVSIRADSHFNVSGQ